MEEETGKATLVGGTAGRQESFHSARTSSTARKYLAVVTCVQTPAKFWARLGEAKSLKDFEGYLATLNEWCSLQKGRPTELPKLKSYIAIKQESLCWQRAQVLKIINDERLLVFCIDTGVTSEVSIEQVCAKQNPILTQQSSQAIRCCLADVTSIGSNNWSEEAIKRFKSLVKEYPVYVDFQTIKQVSTPYPEGINGTDHVTVYLSNPTVPKGIISIGKILSSEGLAKYIGDGDDDDDDDDEVNKKHVSFETKLLSTNEVNSKHVSFENVNTDSVSDDKVMDSAGSHITPQDSESSDDVVVEDSSSDDERSLEENCKPDNNSRSSNNVAVVNVITDGMVESEQVIGPSHLVENKNSFNIMSRAAKYSSSSSSSDEDEDAWDDSLLVKPKATTGITNKADVEKNVQKRKALHAKFNEFLSTPLPLPAGTDRHPFGSRGKRGSRRGAQGIGRFASSGRGSRPSLLSGWSSNRGNQTRNDTQHKKTLLSPQQQFPQQQLPQQQFPQQQFPQQQFPQQQFPQQQFPQQQFPQQQFPQQQQQQFPQQQQQFLQQRFPQQQFSLRQFPQRQFSQQQFPQQPQFQHEFPQQQFSGQRLSPSKQDQPWQHNHSPKLRQLLTNKSPIKSTPQIMTTSTTTTNTSTNITSIEQLDEQGMKNEYEWQKWMIERSVKKALEGLTDETASDFNSQLKKILSDSSASTLNKFPNSKGAVWVITRCLCSHAVDKPVQCSKVVIALREIHKMCTDEMVRLFPEALQSCSVQVLKELTPTNTQCRAYCDLVCTLHRTANNDNTSLQVLVDKSLDRLLNFWTDYALDVNCGGVECSGCVELIVTVFTNITPHMTMHNRTLLERCCKMVRSLILSSIPIKARESLLDFYMIITRCTTEVDIVSSALSSLSVDKPTDQTGVMDSTILNPDKSKQSPAEPDQFLESSIKPYEALVKSEQSPVKLNQSSVRQGQSLVKSDQSNQSVIKVDQCELKLDQPPVKPDQSLVKLDQSVVKVDQSELKPDQPPVKPDQSLVKLDQSVIKVDQCELKLDQPPVKPDQSLVKLNQSSRPDQSLVEMNQPSVKLGQSVKPEQGLIRPDQFSVKLDQTIDQLSQMPTTTVDAPPNHPNVVTATQSYEQDAISSIIATHVNQSSPPIYDPYCQVSAMLTALNLSYLLENFKAAIIQDSLLSCDPSGLKEAMKEAGIPSGAVLSIMHYLSKPETNVTRVPFPAHQGGSYYQYPPVHYPTAAYQPSMHAAYLPHTLTAAAGSQFTSVVSPSPSHQVCSVPASHQVPVGIPSPTHPLQQLLTGWADHHKVTTGPRP